MHPIEIPETLLFEPKDFLARLDRDMNRGWQMGQFRVEPPNAAQRCQLVADRILTAVHQKQQPLVGLASAYILKNLPGVKRVNVNISGEMTETAFDFD